MSYKPRRASRRWLDSDCPKGVLAIFDDPRTIDRYTVFYCDVERDCITYVGMNAAPFHPQGFGQHGELSTAQTARYRYENSHRACRWSDLPEDCKRLVRQDLASWGLL